MDGPNGGELLEVGKGVAKIEVIHNEYTGKVDVYIYEKGGKEHKHALSKGSLKLSNHERLSVNYVRNHKLFKLKKVL